MFYQMDDEIINQEIKWEKDPLSDVPKAGTRKWNPLDFLKSRITTAIVGDLNEIRQIATATSETLERLQVSEHNGIWPASSGREVGDDRVCVNKNPTVLACAIACQEIVLKMKTSWEDTSISKKRFNFCETISSIPTAKEQSFDYCRKTGGKSNLGFVDTVPMRIILPVTKEANDHAGTTVGKVNYMASRQSLVNHEIDPDIHLGLLVQDATLRTDKSGEPKYLPKVVGGSGIEYFYNKVLNAFLYAKCYKNGTYERVYGSAAAELSRVLQDLKLGIPSTPYISRMLRMKKELLHITYGAFVFVPDIEKIKGENSVLPKPLYEALEPLSGLHSVEERLINCRLLSDRGTALLERDKTIKLEKMMLEGNTLQQIIWDKRTKLRSSYHLGNALRGNSAVQNLLSRTATQDDLSTMLRDNLFRKVPTGKLHISMNDVQFLLRGEQDGFTFSDIAYPSDMFVTDEVSCERSLKVEGIRLQPVVDGRKVIQYTTSKLGLWKVSEPMLQWANNKLSQLLKIDERPIPFKDLFPIYSTDLEWVNDDSAIIAKLFVDYSGIPRGVPAIIITNDIKLCRKANRATKIPILRLDPLVAICGFPEVTWSAKIKLHAALFDGKLGYTGLPDAKHVYIDSGSMCERAMNSATLNDKVVRKQLLKTGINSLGERYATYSYKIADRRASVQVFNEY